MKYMFVGAFIFTLAISVISYCLVIKEPIGMLALPFLLAILLIPYGEIKDRSNEE